jgi:hypothetical protein
MKWSERPGQRDRVRASESAGSSNITGQLWVGDAFAMEEEYACRSFVTNAIGKKPSRLFLKAIQFYLVKFL